MTDKDKADSQDTPEINDTPTNQTEPAPKTTKKTTKKKTTKKAASKKTTKKKTSKRAAKKTAKKTSRAKAEPEAKPSIEEAPESSKPQEPVEPEAAEPDDQPEPAPEARSEPEPEPVSDADSDEEGEVKAATRRSRSKKTTKKTASKKTTKKTTKKSASTRSKPDKPAMQAEMIINYVPGEECRIAMLEDGKLEELMVEPTDRVSRVGNIYVGRVMNIEPSIQAVFVDFGSEENGFLHISDLHPQYFAKGDDKTERVGKKTPRKSRPPVQDCIKRGQEIIVQILKEGVGTKGPTLTSYLSIPGRFLVMMPGMDKVGVSRKEEDDDKRKAAKQILSQLELPDGFGFILRTAGFDRNKAELKRDLSYLSRLWKDMETRRKGGNKPRLLYTESDLLVRSIRDLLTSEVSRVVIDSEPALKRVARFIKIAAPRSGAKLSHYTGTKPIFHAFAIEPQINEIHAREVMLPSGGRLVIDQTEALVAIDVNSGKSRAARDAETNAFKTNMEAVDAICRQLRLRDLGGLVVNDMIDMRFHSHRKEVESRFHERLKRDRAKSSTAPISPFGLLEMTRQRMRGSMESQHFADCPMCHGRGLVKRPDSVAASALRDLAALLDHEKVFRAELVVNPRVASALLSTKRSSLTRIELISGKTLDVRVSESLPIDRVSFYAYDESGSDLAIEKLKPAKGNAEPSVVEWRDENSPDGSWAMDPLDEIDETTVQKLAEEIARKADHAEHVELPVEGEIGEDGEPFKKKRRRRRGGRGRGKSEEGTDSSESSESRADSDSSPDDADRAENNDRSSSDEPIELDENGEPIKKKRRRRRRRGGRGRSGEGENGQEESDQDSSPRADASSSDEDLPPTQEPDSDEAPSEPKPRARRRPRRRPSRDGQASETNADETPASSSEDAPSDMPETDRVTEPKPKPRRRSRSKKPATDRAEKPETQRKSSKADSAPSDKPDGAQEKARPKRGLYSNSRRVLSASELAKLGLE